MENFTHISQVQSYHERVRHGHFFDADTMNFFNSQVYPEVYGGRYFVTSEKQTAVFNSHTYPRTYTVREIKENGSIETVGDGFEGYTTLEAARNAAVTLAWKLKQK